MFKAIKSQKWPTRVQWAGFFKILSRRERIFFCVFFLLALSSAAFLAFDLYYKNTKPVAARGGVFIEGVLGQPRFINPIYAVSDIDRDLAELMFSGLMKYDENLKIVPDLIKNYTVEENGRVYRFQLKDDAKWEDNIPISSDDVIFTISIIQNPDYKSPLQANWIGVETEKISDKEFKLKLKKPYAAFLENATLKIIPQHIWEQISPENFPLEVYNLKPIGSGPYKLKEIKQDKPNHIKSLTLSANAFYSGTQPYISEIKLVFFNDEAALTKAAKENKITGFYLNGKTNAGKNWENYDFSFPRYFAVFLNPEKSTLLADKNVRQALNYATNKEEISQKVLEYSNSAPIIVNSPILPEIYGLDQPKVVYEYNIDMAKDLLEKSGYEETEGGREKIIKKQRAFEFKSNLQRGSQGAEVGELQKCLAKFPDIYPEAEITNNFAAKTEAAVIKFQEKYAQELLEPYGFKNGTGIISKITRDKLNQVCFDPAEEIIAAEFFITTVDQPQLIAIANVLKAQWEKIGFRIKIEIVPAAKIQQEAIKQRDYQALLFGEVLGAIPDPFPFWHSSQKKDPGLNLSLYENAKADKLLEDARESLSTEEQKEKLNAFQDILLEDSPAIFLYYPSFSYSVAKDIQGITAKKITVPSERFIGIENWFIKTKRIWK